MNSNQEQNLKGAQIKTIALPKSNDTILSQLEEKGVNINPQCREGYCGSCRCRLLKGKVSYNTEPIAYVSNGDILPCVTVANSDIILDVD